MENTGPIRVAVQKPLYVRSENVREPVSRDLRLLQATDGALKSPMEQQKTDGTLQSKGRTPAEENEGEFVKALFLTCYLAWVQRTLDLATWLEGQIAT